LTVLAIIVADQFLGLVAFITGSKAGNLIRADIKAGIAHTQGAEQVLLEVFRQALAAEHLDEVAQGKLGWTTLLDEFYREFRELLEQAEEPEPAGMQRNEPTMTDIPCGTCGRPMQVRTASTGVFLGCSGYALTPKERCKTTLNLTAGDEAIHADSDDEAESRLLRSKHRCTLCNTAMDSYLIDEQRKLHVCGNNPDCAGFSVEQGQFRIKGYDGPEIDCDRCGSQMQLKSGRFGKYFGCSSDECKNTRKLLRNGEPAPPKADPVPMPELLCRKVDDYYLLRDGAAGIFLAASQFPKNRETRAPLVSELKPHANELDPKFKYLLNAPEADPDGLPAMIRYSRKAKEQYVQSEEEGKATGWKAFYRDGRWVEEAKPAKKSPTRKRKVAKRKATAHKRKSKKKSAEQKSATEDKSSK